MERFNKLFWKIFLACWLTSFSVILVTVVLIGEISERDKTREVIEVRAKVQAEKLIQRYELGLLDNPSSRWYQDGSEGHSEGKERRQRYFPLRIYDQQGHQIYGRQPVKSQEKEIAFTIESSSGIRYNVKLPLDPVSNHLARLQGFMFSVQAILLLITSTLASFLLSFIVVRPVNRLREHVEQFHTGDMQVKVDARLLSRGDEIGALAREFDQMALFVEKTLHSQQRLFQDVSHELRAPLARLQASVGLAEQKLGDSKITQRMNLECERLSRLIDEMLTLARLEHLDAQEGSFNALAVIEQELSDLRFMHPDRELVLTCHVDSPVICRGSVELFERTLSNIFGNIVKHTPEDCSVEIDLQPLKGELIQITIRDHGAGVSAEALASLFEPFYRQSTHTQGYGLGLSIAKRAMERLRGSIYADNAVGGGLKVVLVLPC